MDSPHKVCGLCGDPVPVERFGRSPFDDSLASVRGVENKYHAFMIRPKRSGAKKTEVSNEPPIFPKPDREVYIATTQGGFNYVI
jgi:hypothetical protein